MIAQSLYRHAYEQPLHEAVVASGQRCSYRVLARRVAGLAQRLNLSSGTIVPVVLENGVDFIVGVLGVLAAGGRPLLLSPSLTPTERNALLPEGTLTTGSAVLASERAIDPTHLPPFDEEADPGEPPHHEEILIPTSGSMGGPRVVRLGGRQVVWNADAHARSIGLSATDRLLIGTPMVHAATFVAQLVAAIRLGATLVVQTGPFMPRAFFKIIELEQITSVSLTPTHVRILLERWAKRGDAPLIDPADALRSLRRLSVGAAPIDAGSLLDFAGRMAAISEARLFVTYGLTEAGPRVTTLPADRLEDKSHTVGRPLDGIELRVADPEDPGRDVTSGAVGELQVMTPGRMIGYLGELPLEHGWLRTGDLASLDAEGFLTIHGRLKDVIVCGGATISAVEVERALCMDDRVSEAAVVAEPHAVYGEIVKAYVVPRAPVEADAVLDALAMHLAPHKLPRKLRLVEELPRTATGKVDKRRIRDYFG